MLFQSLLLATAVSAYPSSVRPGAPSISLIFPDGREPVQGEYHKQPCGGSSPGALTDYPLTGGKISMGQGAATDNVNFLWSKFVNGDDYEFKTYGSPTIVDLGSGHYCVDGPDLSSLGFKAGDKATLMVMYQADGPPGRGFSKRWNFQCADVNLVENWTEPSGFMCAKIGNETRVATENQIMNVTVSPSSQPNFGQGRGAKLATTDMEPTKAGGIGAGVTAGVFLLVLGALWAMGLLRFGRIKRNNVHLSDDRSSVSSIGIKQVRST